MPWLWKCSIRTYWLRGIFTEKHLAAVWGQNLSVMQQNKANSVWDQKEFCITFLHLLPVTLAVGKASVRILYID